MLCACRSTKQLFVACLSAPLSSTSAPWIYSFPLCPISCGRGNLALSKWLTLMHRATCPCTARRLIKFQPTASLCAMRRVRYWSKLKPRSSRQVWLYTNITSPGERLGKLCTNLGGRTFIVCDFNIFRYLVTQQRTSWKERKNSGGRGRRRVVWVDSSLVMTDSWH